ncbi:hemagglutinin repeat-containing protein [Nitrincola sp. MINF-07-Sa-05]|uniref:two-partner secretion domain-containing protein n=1 Tax=Nitrincola salilacus TaxID=3400273 RepID=UPI003917ED44
MDRNLVLNGKQQSEPLRQPLWIRSTSWLVLLTFSLTQVVMPGYAAAAPIVDPTAPLSFQPSISATSTGVPVVNITSPNAAGTSLNQYQQFNVGPNGVVLNNSTFSGGTLLGGQVDANPNLNDGRTAITILNEVRGSGAASRSQLDGTIEVFGAPAAVIIANPNGITCHGCGVSNATGFTLSTGKPTETDTGFAFAVSGSDIRIEGNGIEGTVGQIQLIGQRLVVNAPIRAHYLNPQISTISLVAGTGTATVSQGSVSMSPDFSLPAPSSSSGLAIDASEFGAMTSGQIQILSTDRGMGVNMGAPIVADQANLTVSSAGNASFTQLASAGDMVLDAEGNLVVSQSASAGGKLNATSSDGNLVLRGELTSGGNMNLSGNTGLTLSANTHSGGSATLSSQGAVHMTPEASLNIVGDTRIKGGEVTLAGHTSIGQGLEIQTNNQLIISGTTEVGQQAQIDAGEVTLLASFNAQQTEVNADKLSLGNAGETLNISGDLSLDVSGPLLAEGDLNVSGNTRLYAGTDLHLAGEVVTGQHLDLKAGDNIQLDKDIVAGGQIQLEAGNGITADGTITGGALTTQSAELTLNDNVEIGGDVDVVTDHLTLPESVVAGGSIQINVADGGVNSSGVLVANDDLRIQAAQSIALNQTGAGGDLNLLSEQGGISLTEAAQIDGELTLSAAQDIQTNDLSSWGQLQLDSATGSIHTGTLQADGAVSLAALQGQISTGDLQSNRSVTLTSGDQMTAGHLMAGLAHGGDVSLSAAGALQLDSLTVNGDANLQSGADMTIAGDTQVLGDYSADSDGAIMQGGALLTDGTLTLNAVQDIDVQGDVQVIESAQLVSHAGSLHLDGDLRVNEHTNLTAMQDIVLAGDSTLLGELSLAVEQGEILNQGEMQLEQSLRLNTPGDFRNEGLVVSGGEISIQAKEISSNSATAGGLLANEAITLSATDGLLLGENSLLSTSDAITLSNAGGVDNLGQVVAGEALNVSQGELRNSGTVVAAEIAMADALGNQGSLHADQISIEGHTQNSGTLTGGLLNFLSGLINSGQVSGEQITVSGALDNQGELGGDALHHSGGELVNNTTGVIAADQMTLDSSSIWNDGALSAQQLTVLSAGSLTNAGEIVSGGSIQINVADGGVDSSGVLVANDDLRIQAAQSIALNQTGAGGDLNLLSEQGGISLTEAAQIDGELTLSAAQDIQTNDLSSWGQLQLDSATGSIHTGTLQADGAVSLAALQGQISTGDLQSNRAVALSAGDQLTAGHLMAGLAHGGDVSLSAAGALQLDSLTVNGDANLQSGADMTIAGDTLVLGDYSADSDGAIMQGGALLTDGTLTLNAAQDIDVQGDVQVIESAQLVSHAGSLHLDGDLRVNEHTNLTAMQDIVLAGDSTLLGELSLAVEQGEILNQGEMQLEQSLRLNTSGDFRNEGLVVSGGEISIQAKEISSNSATAGGLLANEAIVLDATQSISLGENSQVITSDTITLSSTSGTSNSGQLLAGETLTVSQGGFTNTGNAAATAIDITGPLNNQGSLFADQIDIRTDFAQNSGNLTGNSVTFLAGLNNTGQLSGNDVTVTGVLSNAGQMRATTLTQSGGSLYNTPSGLMAADQMSFNTSFLWNQGRINANELNLWSTGALTNSGTIHGTQSMVIASGGGINNTVNEVQHCINPLSCNDPNVAINPDEDYRYLQTIGMISSGGDLNISSGPVLNQGVIQSSGNMNIVMGQHAFTNQRSPNDHLAYNNAGHAGTTINTGRINAAGTLSIQSGSLSNLDGQINSGNDLTITTGQYLNTGNNTQVFSAGSATLNAFSQHYNPALNPLSALGTLQLNVAGVNVQAGQSWYNPAGSTSWTGTLTNYGTVQMAGHATGTLRNLAGESVTKTGSLPSLHFYQLLQAPSIVDAAVSSYTDVATRASFIIGGRYSGSLTNRASNMYAAMGLIGGANLENVAQTVTLSDAEGNTEEISAQSLSLVGSAGTINIELLSPETGTIIAPSLIISGQSMVSGDEPDFSAVQAALTSAQSQNLVPDGEPVSGAEHGGGSVTPDQHGGQTGASTNPIDTSPMRGVLTLVQNQTVGPDGQPVAGGAHTATGVVPGQHAPIGTSFPAFNGQPAAPGSVSDDPLVISGPSIASNQLNPAPGGSTWGLELPDWDKITAGATPGALNADNLQLNLSGTFTNLADLTGFDQLVIHAQEGIENIGNTISAGILKLSGGSLDTRFGELISSDKEIWISVEGDLLAQGALFQSKTDMTLLAGGSIIADASLNTERTEQNDQTHTTEVTRVGHGESAWDETSTESQSNSSSSENRTYTGARFLAGGDVLMEAGSGGSGSIDLTGAEIRTADDKSITLKAANDITLGAVVNTQSTQSEVETLSSTRVCNDKSGLCVDAPTTTTSSQSTYSESVTGGVVQGGKIVMAAGLTGDGNLNLDGVKITAGSEAKPADVELTASKQINIRGIVTQNSESQSASYDVSMEPHQIQGRLSDYTEQSSSTSETLYTSEITGKKVLMKAGSDMTLSGTAINAQDNVELVADGHLKLDTQTTNSRSNSSSERFAQTRTRQEQTSVDTGVVINAGDNVLLQGDESVELRGTQVSSLGHVSIQSDGDVQLLSGTQESQLSDTEHSRTASRIHQERDVDLVQTRISAAGNVSLIAGMTSATQAFENESERAAGGAKLVLESAIVQAGVMPDGSVNKGTEEEPKGTVLLYGEAGVEVGGRQSSSYEMTETASRSSGFFSKRSTLETHSEESHTFVGSELSGNKVNIISGEDVSLTGSSINAQESVLLQAGRDIIIDTGENTHNKTYSIDQKQSGLTWGGYSRSGSEQSIARTQTTNVGSSITSGSGNIHLQANVAGNEDPEQGIVSITGSQIQSEQGKAIINGKHVLIQAATDTDVTEISGSSDSLTFGFGIGGGKHDSLAVSESHTLQSSVIEGAQGVDVTAPGLVSIQASTLSASNTGEVNLQGSVVELTGGLNHASDTLDEQGKKIGWNVKDLFGVFKPGEGLGHESDLEETEQQTDTVATVLEGKNVNITSTSGDITLAGVDVQTEGGKLTLKTANDLNLHTLTTTDYASSHSEVSDLAWQRVEGSGHKDEAVHYNQLNYAELEVNVGDRINVGMSVKDSAEVLMQEPGMEWVGALINDPELSGKIDWKTVQEAHDSWDYKQQGLTEVGAAVVVIVVAFLTAGAASSAASSLTGAGGSTATFTSTVMSSAIEAGITSIASTSAVTFINSGGDLGETLDALGSSDNLQQILQSMITAGALQGLGQTITIDGKPLASITPADGFIAHAGSELITNITSAMIDSALTGSSLEDSIKDAVIASIINASASQGANWIGDMSIPDENGTVALNDFAQAFSHAILGCMAGSASAGSGDGCAPGAVGGVVGEFSAEFYNPDGTKNHNRTIEFSRMMASIAGAFTGQGTEGVSIAGMTGGNAAANNYLMHSEAVRWSQINEALEDPDRNLSDAERQALEAELLTINLKDRERDLALETACGQGGSPASCSYERAMLEAAFNSYIDQTTGRLKEGIGRDNVRHYLHATVLLGDEQRQRMEHIGAEALSEMLVDAINGPAILGTVAGQAFQGDEESKEILRKIGKEIQSFVSNPVVHVSESNREELARADALEQAGNPDEADVIRIRVALDNQSLIFGAIGLTASIPRIAGSIISRPGRVVPDGGVNGPEGNLDIPTGVPGRVETRINLQNGSTKEGIGFEHVVDRHFNPSKNASQFTVSQNELRTILQSPTVVNSPVVRVLDSADGPRFVREVTLDKPIGTDKFNNFQPTSTFTILTDSFGNLVSATPGVIK